MLKKNTCINCGKQGHQFHQCKCPITSYGMIVYRKHPTLGNQYLMIRRKHSFGYIDFIRGKYVLHNLHQVQQLVDEMSIGEKNNIITKQFGELCTDMWGNSSWGTEDGNARRKFDTLNLRGVDCDGTGNRIFLKDISNRSCTNWVETEWEFPKGRKNNREREFDCAIREFKEETGYLFKNIYVMRNVSPFEETFIGSNHKSYKHKYYLARICEIDNNEQPNFQTSEVSKIDWKTAFQCMGDIRPYCIEKQNMIKSIDFLINDCDIFRTENSNVYSSEEYSITF